MTPDLQTLGQRFIAFSQTEIPPNGKGPRSPATISSFRRAVEGFIKAADGRDVTSLPADFIEKDWMQTQQSVLNQNIQLRVRVSAVKKFVQWLQQNAVAVPQMTFPNIPTPPPKPKSKEPMMSDVTQLADPALNEHAVPSTQTQPTQFQPAMQTAVPPPAPQPRPQQPKRTEASNPLAAMFPNSQGGWKLRVRRERESGEDPVYVGDYQFERVQLAGAVEPFLIREVAPKVVAQGITGDVSFIVSAVDSRGNEMSKVRMTIACTPQTPVQSIPAPVAAAPVAVPTPSTREELLDVLTVQRRAQEEMETRLAERLAPVERVAAAAAAPSNSEMDELKRAMSAMVSTVQTLATKVAELATAPQPVIQAPPPQQQQPDLVSTLRAVMEMVRPAAPQPQQQLGLAEVLGVMSQAKQMFAPAQVNIDVSPLEEEIRDLKKQMAEREKNTGLGGVLEQVKVARELFSLVDPGASAPKSTSLSEALGGLITKAVENPKPIAEAAERILMSIATLKGTPTQSQQSPGGAPAPVRALPAPLTDATKVLLAAKGDSLIVAMHQWLQMLGQVPETQKLQTRLHQLAKEKKREEFAIVLKQALTFLGFAIQPQVATDMAKALFAKLDAIAAEQQAEAEQADAEAEEVSEDELAEDEQAEEGDEEEEQPEGQPDLTVRVGGVQAEDEQDDESDEDGDDEEESDEGEDEPDEDDERDDEQDNVEPEPTPEEPAEEAPKSRRSRKNADKVPPASLGLRELPKPKAVS